MQWPTIVLSLCSDLLCWSSIKETVFSSFISFEYAFIKAAESKEGEYHTASQVSYLNSTIPIVKYCSFISPHLCSSSLEQQLSFLFHTTGSCYLRHLFFYYSSLSLNLSHSFLDSCAARLFSHHGRIYQIFT